MPTTTLTHDDRFYRMLSLLTCVVAGVACGGGDAGSERTATRAEGPLVAYAVNYPLEYFAERIGGELVRVEFPAPSDVDPAFWVPDAETIEEYQQADLIVLNGATYAKWVDRVSLPAGRLVHTSAGFRDQYIEIAGSMTHTHGPEGEHSHAGTAFTTWLDPQLAIQQAEAIKDAFIQKMPEQRNALEEAFDALRRDLEQFDESIGAVISANPDQLLLASHPVYQYLARRYELNLESVQWEPDELPDEGMWRELARLVRRHPANWMIWEAQPLAETVQRLRELGVESLVFSPAANAPAEGDYATVMQENVTNLRRAF